VAADGAGLTIPKGPVPVRMSEHESKRLLREAGIAVPQGVLVRDVSALAATLSNTAFPVAMKIQSRDIPHKSEAGGVRVNVRDIAEAISACGELIANARRFKPEAEIDGVLIEPMAASGIEMIVGTVNDDTFGPIVRVGLGGIATELFKDVVYRPAPVDEAQAAAMIGELKSAALMGGFRGAPKADMAALAALIAQISQLAVGLGDRVSEIEINPVRVHAEGAGLTIVDALIAGRG